MDEEGQKFITPALQVEEQPAVLLLTEDLRYLEVEGFDP